MNLLFATIFAAVCVIVFGRLRRLTVSALSEDRREKLDDLTSEFYLKWLPTLATIHLFVALVVLAEGSWEVVKAIFFHTPEVWFYSTLAFQGMVGLWLVCLAMLFTAFSYILKLHAVMKEKKKE